MSLYPLWARCAGYVTIVVAGAALERLLNLSSTHGIYLWQIRRYRPNVMVANIGLRGWRALRPLLRRTRCRGRIVRRHGLPFLCHRLSGRAGFICGLLLFLVMLAGFTSFIWRIEVVGLKRLPASNIHANLRRLGLYRGVLRVKLEKDRIQHELELMTPDLAWVGIEIRGMIAVVRVVERMGPPLRPPPGDLIAARDGLLTKVVVYRGTPAVAEGEIVRAGQLLVSGTEVTIEPTGALQTRRVPAEALIEARVWDEAHSLIPLRTWRMVPTGRRTRAVRLRYGRRLLSLGSAACSFTWFQQSRTRYGWPCGRNSLPLVELVIDRYDELKPIVYTRTRQIAKTLGITEARALLRRSLPARLRQKTARLALRDEPGWVHVTACLESIAIIAVPEKKRGPKARVDRGDATPVHGGE